jgi:hypothetical protein
VTFETPSDELAKSMKRPAVSCFLHRVVEDIGRRDADWADQRTPEGRVAARQPPVRHYQLHYQVSAWAKSVDEEHELLGKVMQACLGGEIVAAAHLAGVFEGEEQPLLIRLGVPVPDPGPQPHDVWSSLGVPLRASLELTLVAPLRPILVTDIAPAGRGAVDDDGEDRAGGATRRIGRVRAPRREALDQVQDPREVVRRSRP